MKLQPQPSIDTVDWQLSKISLAGKRGNKTKLLPPPSPPDHPLTATFRQGGIAFGESDAASKVLLRRRNIERGNYHPVATGSHGRFCRGGP